MSAEPLAGTAESGQQVARGQGGKPERFKGFSAGPGARAPLARQARSADRDASAALWRLESRQPGPTPVVSSQPSTRTATPGPPRQRLAQGHPVAADLGGPERLEIPPRYVRRPFGGAVWVRRGGLGFEPRPGEGLHPDFAGICLCLLLSRVSRLLAVSVTCCHLPFLPLSSVPINFAFLSGFSLLSASPSGPCFCFSFYFASVS